MIDTSKAVQELDKAEGHQKSANTKVWYLAGCCGILLALIVVIVVLGLGISYVG